MKYIVYCKPNLRGLSIRLVADETRPLDGEVIQAHQGRFTEADVSRFRQIAAELNDTRKIVNHAIDNDLTFRELDEHLAAAQRQASDQYHD